MPDEDLNQEEEQEEEQEQEQESGDNKLIKDLRKQLRAKDKELKDLRPLKETNAFLASGLGNLSEDHKTALRAVVGDNLTTENLITKAKALGFVSEEKAADSEKEQINEEVRQIQQGEKAISQPTAKPDNRDFTTKIREAKSREEVLALISEQGEEHGLLVETD